jgi:hypothetical protein
MKKVLEFIADLFKLILKEFGTTLIAALFIFLIIVALVYFTGK